MKIINKFFGRALLISFALLTPTVFLFCGGGCGSGASFNGGGIGGTGISQGPITGLGSIFVNGVEFDISNAAITVDGIPGNASQLQVGQIVTVNGSFNGTTGTATSVTYENNVEGPVDSVGTNQLEVLGQDVRIETTTKFEPATYAPKEGDLVEVSGQADSTGAIHATWIELILSPYILGTDIEVKGTVTSLNSSQGTFMMGNLMVNMSGMTPPMGLMNGSYVDVKGTQTVPNGPLMASSVEVQSSGLSGGAGEGAQIEGFVTGFTSLSSPFMVNGQSVQTQSSTVYENGMPSNLQSDIKVEVEGVLNASGVLVADKVSFR